MAIYLVLREGELLMLNDRFVSVQIRAMSYPGYQIIAFIYGTDFHFFVSKQVI